MPRVWTGEGSSHHDDYEPAFDPLEHWDALAADVLDVYGVDLCDVLDVWSWPRFLSRIRGILYTPPGRLVVPTEGGYEIQLIWRTRLQHIAHD